MQAVRSAGCALKYAFEELSGKRVLKRISKNKLLYGLQSWPDEEGR